MHIGPSGFEIPFKARRSKVRAENPYGSRLKI
jgi:hypothetical protein